MERVNLTRAYLETLSSADLKDLADEYGIDIPENLTRRFVIAELLEACEENPDGAPLDLCEGGAKDSKSCHGLYKPFGNGSDLPSSYNENKINAVLRNPAWCYVYWDIKKSDYADLMADEFFTRFILRISYFPNPAEQSVYDDFDISVEKDDRDQYVLLSAYARMARFALVAEFEGGRCAELARSELLRIPCKHPYIGNLFLQRDFAPIFTLSGLPDLIRYQYNEHRQSFSMDM
ncbi:DUF4912 domain-containing protein [Treponema sp. HNW]|uniref:DUF4912 domain-containing protein n=1 Tax=Treponema sp. HNW TaxID=3116654 RepID=UPI003D1151CC